MKGKHQRVNNITELDLGARQSEKWLTDMFRVLA